MRSEGSFFWSEGVEVHHSCWGFHMGLFSIIQASQPFLAEKKSYFPYMLVMPDASASSAHYLHSWVFFWETAEHPQNKNVFSGKEHQTPVVFGIPSVLVLDAAYGMQQRQKSGRGDWDLPHSKQAAHARRHTEAWPIFRLGVLPLLLFFRCVWVFVGVGRCCMGFTF